MKKLAFALLFLLIVLPSIRASSADYIGEFVRRCEPALEPGPSGGWDGGSVFTPEVLHDGIQYRMWYSGWNENDSSDRYRVGYAYSTDGVNWQKYIDNPILNVGNPGDWDDYRVWGPAVVFDGSSWMMWYTGVNTSLVSQIGLAISADGVTWEKYAGNPVLSPGPPGGWDEEGVLTPYVLIENGMFHMWYDNEESIGYASSLDGINWDRYPGNPVVTTEMTDPNYFSVRYPSLMILFDEYYMWFQHTWLTPAGFERNLELARSVDGLNWAVQNFELPGACLEAGFGPADRQPSVVLRPTVVRMWYMRSKKIFMAEAVLDLSSLDQVFFLPVFVR